MNPSPSLPANRNQHGLSLRKAVALGLLMLIPVAGHAQTDPQVEFDNANNTFDSGNYQAAVEQFEKFVADYPTNALVFAARLRLAFAAFLAQQLEKATEQAKILTDANSPAAPEIKELAQGLLPQITAAIASTKPAGSDEQKKLFEQAIAEFGEFLKKYPRSADADQALYGRALSSYQIRKFDEAIEDLRTSLKTYPRSDTILDTQYLLALALSTKAANEAFNNPGSPTFMPLFQEAESILRELQSRKGDLAVSNDATFQLGETLLNRAIALGTTNEAEQQKLFSEALAAFRSVLPKEKLLEAQEARIQQIRDAITQAGAAANVLEMNRLRKLAALEARKTGQIQARPNIKFGAMLKLAEIYFRLNNWNALRTVANYLRPLTSETDEQKMLQYYTALSYAAQALRDKAVAAYEEFQSKHRGDPIAENLPIFMGRMFLDPKINQPDEAVKYFQEAQDIYPNGQFRTAAATQQARALVELKRYDEAIKAYEGILQSKPAKEVAASAELGIAIVRESTSKFDEAIDAFRKIRETYAGLPEAEEAFYRIGSALLAKGDAGSSAKEFQAFLQKHGDGQLAPAAHYFLAQAQGSLGEKQAALATYATLAEKFPDNQFAPFSYFQRATLLASSGDREASIDVLRKYIEKYPDHANIYNAYAYIGETLVQIGKPDEAVAAYEAYVTARPKEQFAPVALLAIMDIQRGKADTLGRYVALNDEEKAAWKKATDAAQQIAERILTDYTDTPQVALALQKLLSLNELRTESELQKPEDTEAYFLNLAKRFEGNPGAKSKILFAYATFLAKTNAEKALQLMSQAYDPTLIYAPADMDKYGELLIAHGNLEKAAQVYTKLGEDFPMPADGTPPAPNVSAAQAASLFGLGTVAQLSNDSARARELFEQLKREHPGSAKSLQADLGIARSLSATGEYEQGLALLAPIIAAAQAPGRVRAEALYLGGMMHKLQGNTDIAIDFLEKVELYFPDERDFAPDAVWEAGQLLEQKAASETDAKKKEPLLTRARSAYETIVNKYADSAFKAKAEERLAALPQR